MAPVTGHTLSTYKGMNGDEHPSSPSHLTVSMEDAENTDRYPVSAQLLTTLFLLGFFGAIVGLLKDGRLWHCYVVSFAGYLQSSPFQRSRQARTSPLLSVFRL